MPSYNCMAAMADDLMYSSALEAAGGGVWSKIKNIILTIIRKIKDFVRGIIDDIQWILGGGDLDTAIRTCQSYYYKQASKEVSSSKETLDLTKIKGLSTYQGGDFITQKHVDDGGKLVELAVKNVYAFYHDFYTGILKHVKELITLDASVIPDEMGLNDKLQSLFADRKNTTGEKLDLETLTENKKKCKTLAVSISAAIRNKITQLSTIINVDKSGNTPIEILAIIANAVATCCPIIWNAAKNTTPELKDVCAKIKKRATVINKNADIYEKMANRLSDTITQGASTSLLNLSKICQETAASFNIVVSYLKYNPISAKEQKDLNITTTSLPYHYMHN